MIYGNSSDPVLIKKISLRIWTLRDELEAVIKERISEGQERPPLEDLMKEYKSKGSISSLHQDDSAGVKDASELDDFGEDEMARAIAEAEAAEKGEAETSEEETPSEEANQEESDADAMAREMLGDQAATQEAEALPDNVVALEVGLESNEGRNVVKQRIPSIPEEKISVGKAILSEIYMDQMYFFSSKPFLTGQSIVLDFLVPRRFVMNADVTFCRTYNMKSRIISKNRLSYRVGIKFTYLKEGERTILREFTRSIEPDVETVVAAKEETKEEKSSGGDDFDIFDDLDD
ncbi:hypothetical protein [Bacteriovorax sp. Seq25_V]|uniref:hypothetical protein n=1 Tax=Bacteriovorax sp. Seq25_V TaxID=1201288 RepID=UPI00038A0E33|nr:hypothetical protein [Bacteriovorax sp. Seq25_V]EQC46511.1 hypothetical protein M900_2351 [Bacteriovorax sp. Seq25_V]